jgi:hypothetical protein
VHALDAEGWNDEVATAWRRAYSFVSMAMLQGLAGVGTTAVNDLEATSKRRDGRTCSP